MNQLCPGLDTGDDSAFVCRTICRGRDSLLTISRQLETPCSDLGPVPTVTVSLDQADFHVKSDPTNITNGFLTLSGNVSDTIRVILVDMEASTDQTLLVVRCLPRQKSD